MIDRKLLAKIYKTYGFQSERSNDNDVLVFSLMAGHYHNVDIVPLSEEADPQKIFEDFSKGGYACTIRNYQNIEQAEKSLFEGFFSLNATQQKFKNDYFQFTESIAKLHSETATYTYIRSRYDIDEKVGKKTVTAEVQSRLDEDGPVLFLIEAAAGFGKTCTAYEILQQLVTNRTDLVPLFTELARNRQAKIFRYVLLDEIDRTFPTLSLNAVNNEIKKGNVPVILDGFDELLHESAADSGYDDSEPMLETIGKLLTEKAKIILTTRRTSIFDGDKFHQWMETHAKNFDVIRIRIHEPTIADWLKPGRISDLEKSGFDIKELSNPVLLSYLRSISDAEFQEAISSSGELVNKYFTSMLERERIRQDLLMSPDEQYEILLSVARDMMDNNYTMAAREHILTVIRDNNQEKIERVRKDYPPDKRPTTDEIVNKLASHALLDRSANDEHGIGFVNEFVLGNFCAEIIVEKAEEGWLGEELFIEPSVLSYIPRTKRQKRILWEALKFSLSCGEGNSKVIHSLALNNEVLIDLDRDSIERLKFTSIELGIEIKVENTMFYECTFRKTVFHWDSFHNSTFMNCDFFDCSEIGDFSTNYVVACKTNNQFLIDKIDYQNEDENESHELILSKEEVFVLVRFWPKGRQTFHKHRQIKALIGTHSKYSSKEIMTAIDLLKKRKYLNIPTNRAFLELNLDKLSDIKLHLGRS